MWKYIIITSTLLLGGSYFLFQKHNTTLTADADTLVDSGDLAKIQKKTALASKSVKESHDREIRSRFFKLRANRIRIAYAVEDHWCKLLINDKKQVDALTEKVEKAIAEQQKETKSRVDDFNAAVQVFADSEQTGLDSVGDVSAIEIKSEGSTVGPNLYPVATYGYPDASEVTDFAVGLIDPTKETKKHNLLVALKIKAREREIEVLNNVLNDHEEHITLETALKEQRARKKASAELDCLVTFVNRDYGFIHINAGAKGDKNRVLKGSELTVLRGGKKVCDLIVTQVTDTEAIAYVQDGTLGVGDRVKVGDKVVAKKD